MGVLGKLGSIGRGLISPSGTKRPKIAHLPDFSQKGTIGQRMDLSYLKDKKLRHRDIRGRKV